MITREKAIQEENVAEYMKLVANADKQQTQRILSVFEAKNNKSVLLMEKVCYVLYTFNYSIYCISRECSDT